MSDLPRLLYFSDVLAESSHSGGLLMYRLLESYPAERLFVVETSHCLSRPEWRLPGVTYASIQIGSDRLGFTRVHAWWSLWMTLRAASWATLVADALGTFKPEAVLTVVHGHAWAAAAEFAKRRRLPLHLIVHDDWPRMVAMPRGFRDRVDRQLRPVYQSAVSRLCVSPWMADAYRERYGAEARVCYPARARTTGVAAASPERLAKPISGLTVAFAGNIRGAEAFQLLGAIARELRPRNGRVILYGPISRTQASASGLNESNVEFAGMFTAGELAARLRAEADVLLVPMSFDPAEADNARLSFPSKLVDYTAVGLPLLICAPEYASAVQWARQHPGVADVVVSKDPATLRSALATLAHDPEHRVRLATQALDVGTRVFSHQAAWSVFTQAMRQSAAGRDVV